MAKARYFKDDRTANLPTPRMSSKQFVDYHVGSEEPKINERHGEPYYPRGVMSAKHTPTSYIPTFSNESTHPTGLSDEYMSHLETENDEHYDRTWDNEAVPHPAYRDLAEADSDLFRARYNMHRNESPAFSATAEKNYNDSLAKFSRSKEGSPQTLFVEKPAETQITGAFFDPHMRAHAPLLASLIHQDFGGTITADSDLSYHSSRFVKKAQKLGLPIKTHAHNPDAEVTNNEDFSDMGTRVPLAQENPSYYKDLKEIPETEVKSARQNLKTMIRGNKSHISPQFEKVEHPKLPGI
jgi:hypothetical protein